MNLPDRHMLLGMTLGALCGVAVSAIGPGFVVTAFADELIGPPAPAIDTAQIVKFEGRDYQIENEDWVSTDATSTVRVKKIEAGKVSYVTITTTPTGTYSTDAMFSRHVQYPGVTVTDVTEEAPNRFSYWSKGHWFAYAASQGHSFVYYGAHW